MAASEGSNSSHRSGSGEDSDTDYENDNIRPRGLTGLQNLGNTCYLNSAVQSLSNCPPLTRYFLDCPTLIRPDKSQVLSRSYLKLISELWHKKRPSYVVPSGIVSGIKAVHPMFRGYTQQDAQEFLRCFMDQLHEELKSPVMSLHDESDEEDENNERQVEENGSNGVRLQNSNSSNSHVRSGSGDQQNTGPEVLARRPSFDSLSSQSELEYETCDSALSSERSSNGSRGSSGDESFSDSNDLGRLRPQERTRNSSAVSTGSGGIEEYQTALDTVANTKEMKETANLLEKETEMRRPRLKAVMEGGDCKGQSALPYITVGSKDAEGQANLLPSEMHPKPQLKQSPAKPKKSKPIRFDSIVSQTFDGKINSSVRCLNCETVSTTKETFQDLSLPIPSKDHLHMLHSGYPTTSSGVTPPKGGTCGEVHQGWLSSMFSWMKSWFVGPIITLQDCLSAFFSADELKGDNMYSCEKCKKLRNGLKYSKVLELPEILSIHLKRFRHEFYSSKISTYISFPLEGLDMSPYIHKGCNNEVTLYDLVAIICHHGTAGGGHYTAYCLNSLNRQWYEFDDQYVTEVDVSQVQNCEAYVLFYKKSDKKVEATRRLVAELEADETSFMKFYISKQWVSRFRTFAEPGPVTNLDFLCKHGGVPPVKVDIIDDLFVEIHQQTWELLYSKFGGGPVCNHLYACKTCHSELEKLRQRQQAEKDAFIQLNDEFQEEENAASVYAISMAWFKEWECFVREKKDTPPDAIDNSRISIMRNGQPVLRQSSDYGHLSKDMWQLLYRIYGGGPEVVIRQSTGVSVKKGVATPNTHQTLAALAASGTSPASGVNAPLPKPSAVTPPPAHPPAVTCSPSSAMTSSSSSSPSPPPPPLQTTNSCSPASTRRESLSSSSSLVSSSESYDPHSQTSGDADVTDKTISTEKIDSNTDVSSSVSPIPSLPHNVNQTADDLLSSDNSESEKVSMSCNKTNEKESEDDNDVCVNVDGFNSKSEAVASPSQQAIKSSCTQQTINQCNQLKSQLVSESDVASSAKETSDDGQKLKSLGKNDNLPATQEVTPQIHSFGKEAAITATDKNDVNQRDSYADSGISSASEEGRNWDSLSLENSKNKLEDVSNVTVPIQSTKGSGRSPRKAEKQDVRKAKVKSKKGKQMDVTRI